MHYSSRVISLALITLMIAVTLPTKVHALNASAAAERTMLKTTRASAAAELRETVQEAREVRKATMAAARRTYRSERAQVHGERLDRRFAFYAQRLTTIATRIQTRIDTKKQTGADVATAQAALDKAKLLITQATSEGAQAVSLFENITVTTWDLQAPQIKAAIEQANKARMSFVSARLALLDAAAAL
jgi:hypothetical protein